MFLLEASRQGSVAPVGRVGSDGSTSGIRGAVWDRGAVYRAPGRASLAPVDLSAPAAAGGKPGGSKRACGSMNAPPATGRNR